MDQRHITEITDISTSGDGIGRVDGMVVFVPGTVPGDLAEIEIVSKKKNLAYGRVTEIKSRSLSRIEPMCACFGECGGCQLQNMEYSAQVELKHEQLVRKMQQLCGKENMPVIEAPIAVGEPYRYRNKTEFNIRGVQIGFYRYNSNELIECSDCLIQNPAASAAARALKDYLRVINAASPFKSARGGSAEKNAAHGKKNAVHIRRMIVRTGQNGSAVMIILAADSASLPGIDRFIDYVKKQFNHKYELKSLVLDINKSAKITGPGKYRKVIYGSGTLSDEIAGLKFEISPYSFYQVNTLAAEMIYKTALEYAELTGNELVYDLYCGVGTVGLFMAERARYVWGIEALKSAVLDANRNAVLNGIVNIQFIEGRAEYETAGLIEKTGRPDVIVVDPPRAGLKRELTDTILKALPDRIVYISCDMGTLMRDLKLLSGAYRVDKCRIADQFCLTVHVETVCLLGRRKPDDTIKVSVNMDDYYQIRDAEEAEKNPS